MAMKPTTEAPLDPYFIGGKDSDGDSIRKFRSYVFNEADDLLSAIRFWTKKQEIGK